MKKESQKRYVVKMRQNTKKHVKAWRITDFIEKINNSYYKKELLKEIIEKLNNGVNPENIIILDKSFNIHKANKNIKVLKLNTVNGVKKLYHLGKPYSLYPNEKIIVFNNVFITFSTLYTLFNQYKVKLNKSILKDTFNEIFTEKEKLILEFTLLSEELDRSLSLVEDSKDRENLRVKKVALLEELKENIETETKAAKDFIKIDKDIKDEGTLKKKMGDKKYKELASVSPNKFTRYLISTIRPIVGIYNPEKNQIEILASNFIKKDGFDERQIDLKNVSHNSPFSVTVIAGITFLLGLYQMHCNKYDAKAIDKEEVDTYSALLELDLDDDDDDDDDESDTEEAIEKSKIRIEEWLQTREELEELIQKNKEVAELEDDTNHNNSNVPISVIKALGHMENRVQTHFDKAFENNDFKDGFIEVAEEDSKEAREELEKVI
ncbi:hypothetical protein [Lysinibacillus odysseyi]|uniref:Uncharacterized protein n=1 Tax=Lysinibacillus odysseyi 34hs-1 = NBRC 100172 TaxID=1220589 RepID=A0A0A3IH13_9BACI|nr:hypothetical protein [Lysinibacillus odysseyi]KGR82750.1 hypothetical protein CD32_18035 [Lysinibacillus odysseyi 34hs-1 = NBRC 100172]